MALLSRSFAPWAATVATAVVGLATPAAAWANQFGQQTIDPNLAIPVATPVRDGAFYNLMILEQVPNQRQCWQEQSQADGPTVVDPLLLNFDFVGSCDRKTDSNGYSVRINGEDLGVHYRLELSTRQDDLVLFARHTRDRSIPPIEIGRTNGRTNGLLRIQLNSGWQLTRRLYNGRPTGHIYVTHDAPLAYGPGTSPATPVPATPVTPATPAPATPTPGTPNLPAPTLPSVGVRPTPGSPSTPATPSPSTPNGSGFRVIVPVAGPTTLPRVRAVEPSAFRTTLDGQAVVQAGVFQEQQRAEELRQTLMAARLSAQVISGNAALPSPTPSPTPPSGGSAGSSHFRVVVPIRNGDTLQQVRTVEPEAFRTSVDGQDMVQVGLFQERQRAEEVYQTLIAASLPAQILNAPPPAVSTLPPIPQIPRERMVVVIDPGHGGRDPGAIGIGGIQEKQINMTISNRVQQQLEAAGVTVLMTRTGDQWVDLDARAQYANRAGADVFVSIHANAISMSRPEVNGLETYYLSSGERLARTIHTNILRNVSMRDRGVRQARFYVLRHTSMPAVLVETGFVTGAEDAARFRNPAAVNQIADGIARGILEYLGRA